MPVFYDLLDKEAWFEDGRRVMRWADVDAEAMGSIVEWLYTGEYTPVLPVLVPQYDGKSYP